MSADNDTPSAEPTDAELREAVALAALWARVDMETFERMLLAELAGDA